MVHLIFLQKQVLRSESVKVLIFHTIKLSYLLVKYFCFQYHNIVGIIIISSFWIDKSKMPLNYVISCEIPTKSDKTSKNITYCYIIYFLRSY